MDMFILDSPCEAVDGEGHWTRATVVDVHEDEGFMVSFEGWGTRFNRRVPLTEIRPRTEAVEALQRKQQRRELVSDGCLALRRLVTGDQVQFRENQTEAVRDGKFLPACLWFKVFWFMPLQDILAISKVCTFWAEVVSSGRFWREFGPAHLTKSDLLKDLHSVVPMFKGVRQLTIDLSLVTDLEVLANLGNLLKLEIYSNFRCAHETEEIAHGLKLALRTVTDFISKGIKFSAEEQLF